MRISCYRIVHCGRYLCMRGLLLSSKVDLRHVSTDLMCIYNYSTQELNLANNKIVSVPFSIATMRSLTELDLQRCPEKIQNHVFTRNPH